MKKADTFIDLAKQMDIPTTTFVETMENYNKYCEQGYDDEFMKKPKHLRPLQEVHSMQFHWQQEQWDPQVASR